MLPATISTSVAPETINKVSRLFNGSVTDILHELLQNARRAGAGTVAVSTIGRAGDRLLHIVDDGHGIADPASIVTLGRSGWNETIARREDPAGMGVFKQRSAAPADAMTSRLFRLGPAASAAGSVTLDGCLKVVETGRRESADQAPPEDSTSPTILSWFKAASATLCNRSSWTIEQALLSHGGRAARTRPYDAPHGCVVSAKPRSACAKARHCLSGQRRKRKILVAARARSGGHSQFD